MDKFNRIPPREVFNTNLEQLKYLVNQANTFNSKEACGKIYVCLEMLIRIIDELPQKEEK